MKYHSPKKMELKCTHFLEMDMVFKPERITVELAAWSALNT